MTGDTVATLRARTRLRTFNLDLLLRADSVAVDGRRAGFRQGRHELTVRPSSPVARGATVRVRVAYSGRPAGIRYGGERPFTPSATGAIAVGEPGIAAWWYPCNDHPRDKALYDVRLVVPKGFEAISNGALLGHHTVGRTTRWRWSVGSPMATYLAFAAFGQYDLERGTAKSGLPYVYAFEHGLSTRARAGARASLHQTPVIVRWLETKWGRYPFRNLGGVVPAARLNYALENQTRPVYGRVFFAYGRDRSVVVHELSHQWFGDRVSLSRWRDIWLNEGFATYSEWLWEYQRGGRSPQTQLQNTYRLFDPTSSFWDLKIGDPGPRRLFDTAVYDRGAMVVQALRNRLGTPMFFHVARSWVHGGSTDGHGSVPELKRLAERLSGKQLDGFFRHWLFSSKRPAATKANGLAGV